MNTDDSRDPPTSDRGSGPASSEANSQFETSASLLEAALESIVDGVLVVDREGEVTSFNQRFLQLWRIPASVAATRDERQLIGFVRDQLKDPTAFLRRVEELYDEPDAESFDVLELEDGRLYERYSQPQRIAAKIVGRVWSFRDVTERKRTEDALRESEARFRTMFEGAAIGIILEDLEGNFLETNRAIQEMLGYPADELRGMHYKTVTYPDDIGLREEDYLDMVAGKRDQFQVQKRYTRKDGRVVWARTTVSLGRGPTGEPRFAIAMIEDVSERKRAEDAVHFLAGASGILASSLDFHRTLTNLAQLTVPTLADWCVVDVVEDGNIYRVAATHVDPAKQEALREIQRRYPPDWESPQPSTEVLRTGKPVLIRDVTEAVLDARTSGPEHKRLLRTLGSRSAIVVPLLARGHKLGAISLVSAARRYGPDDLAVAEDLGRRAAVAVDNARLYEAALAASKAKSDFLAVMSHELRTPLSAVTGYADLLEGEITGPLTQEQKAQLRLIRLRAQDLLRIIEEVLTFSRMEAGRARIRLERVDLSSLVREVLAVARPLAEEKGLDLHVRLPADPIEVETDQDKAGHILLDLLSNAVKFTERGEIELSAGIANRTLFFRVRDTGIGIRPEYHEKIFQPFFQLEAALTREAGGTGLGLAVARRLARFLGGDITLKSALGKGSEFTVRLPAPA